MSSPIAIPVANNTRRASAIARSLPDNASGLYVPVHRRGASASSLPERTSKPRPRSVSPSCPASHDRRISAHIPPASTIPQARIYSLTQLLALSSSPAVGLSPPQRAQVDSHIPLMFSRTSSSSRSTKTKTTDPGHADTQKKQPDASPRRRRTGRKPSATKSRVPVAVGTDVEGRRRRTAYGAGWGWSPAERAAGQRADFGRIPPQGQSWRAAPVAVAATA
ncbi:hypothetical protein OH77DRAFT_1406115 [Trametes cingulata]|nr:hypothetical protein OH77DRAFT_1406115 [Trametes cingulata]